ncbi:hypothetical protein COLO4_35552 [Corchorus olitorius]|uniref:Uncharacterized protein n=1 Tax=Corchorus olitorius TaxID=93759 RepID=A0A1R3GFH4_9ROSI|nr:hypothetical protein COLO4_35552 [Corchorus olitorius]
MEVFPVVTKDVTAAELIPATRITAEKPTVKGTNWIIK